MKTILIATVFGLLFLTAACQTDADEGFVDSSDITEPSSVLSTSPQLVGENPTLVASSIEALPVLTIVPEPEPTPPSLPSGDYYSLTPEEIQVWEQLTADSREVGDKVLADTDQFTVTYLISNRQVIVLVKALPFGESKIAAEEWFVAQGLSPQSLCVIVRINFVPSKEVTESGYEFKAEDSVPSGCDVPNS